jgi:hypothetical protein
LLGIKADGAQDLSQQPALAYSRLINSLRADITVGIRQLCDLELMLHGIDPKAPENGYEIIWPKIVINSFEEPVSDESELVPDMEADRYKRALKAFDKRKTEDRSELKDAVYSNQLNYWKHNVRA